MNWRAARKVVQIALAPASFNRELIAPLLLSRLQQATRILASGSRSRTALQAPRRRGRFLLTDVAWRITPGSSSKEQAGKKERRPLRHDQACQQRKRRRDPAPQKWDIPQHRGQSAPDVGIGNAYQIKAGSDDGAKAEVQNQLEQQESEEKRSSQSRFRNGHVITPLRRNPRGIQANRMPTDCSCGLNRGSLSPRAGANVISITLERETDFLSPRPASSIRRDDAPIHADKGGKD